MELLITSSCNVPREKGMFKDVNIKFQVQVYLKFDVDVLKHAFFLRITTYIVGVVTRIILRKKCVEIEAHLNVNKII